MDNSEENKGQEAEDKDGGEQEEKEEGEEKGDKEKSEKEEKKEDTEPTAGNEDLRNEVPCSDGVVCPCLWNSLFLEWRQWATTYMYIKNMTKKVWMELLLQLIFFTLNCIMNQ